MCERSARDACDGKAQRAQQAARRGRREVGPVRRAASRSRLAEAVRRRMERRIGGRGAAPAAEGVQHTWGQHALRCTESVAERRGGAELPARAAREAKLARRERREGSTGVAQREGESSRAREQGAESIGQELPEASARKSISTTEGEGTEGDAAKGRAAHVPRVAGHRPIERANAQDHKEPADSAGSSTLAPWLAEDARRDLLREGCRPGGAGESGEAGRGVHEGSGQDTDAADRGRQRARPAMWCCRRGGGHAS